MFLCGQFFYEINKKKKNKDGTLTFDAIFGKDNVIKAYKPTWTNLKTY